MAAIPLRAQGSLPSMPDGPTGKLCQWIASVSLDDVPNHIVERTKYLILDGIACALVGAHLPWSEKATNSFLDMEPEGSANIIGYNKVLSIIQVVLNGIKLIADIHRIENYAIKRCSSQQHLHPRV